MKVIVGGLNHKTAEVEVRERFSLTTSQRKRVLKELKKIPKINEGLVLSTCNRTEFYLVTAEEVQAQELITKVLDLLEETQQNQLQDSIYVYSNLAAVEHVYQVVSGLDSLVVGETQIVGQVKEAFELAQDLDLIDSYLHRLFSEALRVGKKARSQTKINEGAASVSYAAVELAKQIFGCLAGETVLILGAGETSELTLKSLVDHGVKGVMVSNRTHSRAQKLADQFEGQAIKWDQLENWLEDVDIVIASTGAPHYVLHYDLVEKTMKEQCRGPLFLIDIAVPRDIEPQVERIDGVHLYDIDDIKGVVDKNIQQRQTEINRVEEIIDEELKEFEQWISEQEITPLIKQMREQAHQIKEKELQRAKQRLDNGEDLEELLEDVTNKLTNKLLHHPTVKLKETAKEKGSAEVKALQELFSNG